MSLSNFEIISLSISIGLLVTYNVIIYASIPWQKKHIHSNHPIQLAINLNNSVNWLNNHKSYTDPASNTLAIQTLRNIILVAVFIGGISFNLSISLLTNSTNNDVSTSIISICLFISFLCWVMVIRMSSQLGFMITGWYFYY